MNATVTAAVVSGCFGLLGVGGTVVVAVAGFRANKHIVSDTARAERDKGMWEKRCAAYEDIISIIDNRQSYRSGLLSEARRTAAGGMVDRARFSGIATKYTADYHDPATQQARSRQMAYASNEVQVGYFQMVADDQALGIRLQVWSALLLLEQTLDVPASELNDASVPSADEYWEPVEDMRLLVQTREHELLKQIRQELGSDPASPTGTPTRPKPDHSSATG